jgi:hypothetical protein
MAHDVRECKGVLTAPPVRIVPAVPVTTRRSAPLPATSVLATAELPYSASTASLLPVPSDAMPSRNSVST